MNIKELEFGNVVKLRNEKFYLLHPSENYRYWINEKLATYLRYKSKDNIHLRNIETGFFYGDLSDYDDDFNVNIFGGGGYDIMEIYEDYTLEKLLWKREEEEE